MKQIIILTTCVLSCGSVLAEQPSCQEPIKTYANRINFNLLRFGYEHIMPDAVYVGTEGWYILGFNPNSEEFGLILGMIEGRVGYNFLPTPRNKLTPFIGGGYFKSFELSKKQEILYPSIGVRYEHEFGTIFNLGLNLEGMRGHSLNTGRLIWGDPIWGMDVGLPFTWRFTKKGRWDVRVEPFFTAWYGQYAEYYFGGLRSAIGYRF